MSSFELILHLMIGLLFISNASDARKSLKTTIYVDKSGSGDYSSVQEAINSVPDGNNQWIRIVVKPGTYNEKVNIPLAKQYIFLQGESHDTTTIRYWDAGSASRAATFQLYADNFAASDITFKNSYNIKIEEINSTQVTTAPAALIAGDKVSFRRCAFHGIQDTLADMQGRHYFKQCFISGAIDFIWGHGQSVYEDCLVKTIASYIGQDGYVTAQGREGANQPSGFVFKSGQVMGEGRTYLGRAWRRYSRVLFYETSMNNVVLPKGWSSWSFRGHEHDITFAEVGCKGEGAGESGRVKWMKHLPPRELEHLLSNSFVNKEGWIEAQPS